MKMLFSSSDAALLEEAQTALAYMDIPSEVRLPRGADQPSAPGCYPELWIQREEDFQNALKLSVTHALLLRKA